MSIDAPDILFDEELHQYTVNGAVRPHVTQILATLGFIDFSGIPQDRLEAARQRGIAVHAAIQFIEEDDLDWSTVAPVVRPYVDAFLEFKEEVGYRTLEREKVLFHEELNYCGRVDAIAEMTKLGVERAVIDYKSGAILPATKYQLAAYAMAAGEDIKVPRFSLHLMDYGKYKLIADKKNGEPWIVANRRNDEGWRTIVRAYHLRMSLGRNTWML